MTQNGVKMYAQGSMCYHLPDDWFSIVKEWRQLNSVLKANEAPDANDEYLIYQTLVGAYPMPGQPDDDFGNRVQEYLKKALREAKTHSSWTTPDDNYESAVKSFAVKLLDPTADFWKTFITFHKKVSDFGIVNSLAQVLLSFTCPGNSRRVPGDRVMGIFKSLNPAYRRPVDYGLRQRLMNELESEAKLERESLLSKLWQQRYSAKIKLWLVHTLFNQRRANAAFFANAAYLPLTIAGEYNSNIVAFARHYEDQWYVVVIPVHLATLAKKQQQDEVLDIDWKDTYLVLPEETPAEYEHLFTGQKGTHQKKR